MASWYDIQDDFHRSNDNWWKKFVKGLNNAFNPYHAWFDYDKWNEDTVLDKVINSVDTLIDHVANPDVATSLVDKYTGAHLTGAEQEANAFSAEEAQKSRDFTEYMARNKYSMETQSMQEAGVNPAMVYGGGSLVPTAANGSHGASVAPQMGDIGNLIMSLIRMPAELRNIESQAQRNKDEGDAALINAGANVRNAESNESNAESAARQAAVAEGRLIVEQELKDANIRLTNTQIDKLVEEKLNIAEATKYISKNWEVANKNANAAQKQALAAMRQADAAVQNAATNDRLSEYQTDMLYSQRLGQDLMNGKSDIELKYLPERLQAEVEEFRARGFYFDAQGHLANKNMALVTAQTIRQYELMVTDVANAVVNVAGAVATGGLSAGMKGSTSVTWDPAPANGTYGTYGDVGTQYWFNQ